MFPDGDSQESRRLIPFTNVELKKVEDQENVWQDSFGNVMKESAIYKNMAGDLVKAVLRVWGWLSLDLLLYGPGTFLKSIGWVLRRNEKRE